MAEHPIQGLMKTAMESIREMVDVNTIVGDPVEAQDGSVMMPISRVSFGFAAGGAEYSVAGRRAGDRAGQAGEDSSSSLPFGGGSGAGVSIKPVGFLVVGQGQVRMLTVDGRAFYDRLIDLAPQLMQELQSLIRGSAAGSHAETAGRGSGERMATGPAPRAAPAVARRVRTRPEV